MEYFYAESLQCQRRHTSVNLLAGVVRSCNEVCILLFATSHAEQTPLASAPPRHPAYINCNPAPPRCIFPRMLPTLMLAPPQLPAVTGATGPHPRAYLPVASAGPPPSSYAALYPVAPPNATAPTLPVLSLAPPKKTRSKYETGYYRSVFAERPPRPLSSSSSAAAAAPPPQPTVKNWNADFQSIISELSTAEEEEEKLRLYNRLSHLAHDFVYVAKTYGKIIIMERCLPHEAKTIKPVRRATLVL